MSKYAHAFSSRDAAVDKAIEICALPEGQVPPAPQGLRIKHEMEISEKRVMSTSNSIMVLLNAAHLIKCFRWP